jgi:hypothetical protein
VGRPDAPRDTVNRRLLVLLGHFDDLARQRLSNLATSFPATHARTRQPGCVGARRQSALGLTDGTIWGLLLQALSDRRYPVPMADPDLFCMVAESLGVDAEVVAAHVAAWLAAAADALDDGHGVDLGALGRLHAIVLPEDEHRAARRVAHYEPARSSRLGLRLGEIVRVGPVQPLG